MLPHLDLRVGLPRADDALPLPVEAPSRPAAAGPQRERGPLPQHTAACAQGQLSLSPVHHWRVLTTEKQSAHQVVLQDPLVRDSGCGVKTPAEGQHSVHL